MPRQLYKTITYLRSAVTATRDAFQQQILSLARNGLDAHIGAAALTVNLVLLPPENLPYRPPSDPDAGKVPEYDVIVEAWSETPPADLAIRLGQLVFPLAEIIHPYAVTDTIIYDRRPFPRGQPSDGIKLIGRLMFHADLPDSAAKRSWSLHAPLAARVHVGSAIYVQNWVETALSEGCPAARGIPVMHFPTERDFLEGFFDSPRGLEEILQDTSHFVASGPRFYTTEYVIVNVAKS